MFMMSIVFVHLRKKKWYCIWYYCNKTLIMFFCSSKMVVTRTNSQNGTAPTEVSKSNGTTTVLEPSAGNETLSKVEKKLLRTVFLSLVIDLLAFTVILPLLPSLLDFYGTQEVFHISFRAFKVCV